MEDGLSIYVLIEETSKAFFVWYCLKGEESNVWKHPEIRKKKTIQREFALYRKLKKEPYVVTLEEGINNYEEAIRKTLIWSLFFIKNGMNPLYDDVLFSTKDMSEEEKKQLAELYTFDINEILKKEKQKVAHVRNPEKYRDINNQNSEEKRVEVRFHLDDYAVLLDKVEKTNKTMSAYIREAVLDAEIKSLDFRFLDEFLFEVSRLNDNLREIKYLRYENKDSNDEFLAILNEIIDIEKKVINSIKKNM